MKDDKDDKEKSKKSSKKSTATNFGYSDEDIQDFRKNISDSDDYLSLTREDYHNDRNFVFLEEAQWREDVKKEYKDLKKPMLTFNMLPRLIFHLCSEFGISVPNIRLIKSELDMAVSEELPAAEKNRSELLIGMIRKLGFSSATEHIYRGAFENVSSGGFGAWLFTVEDEGVYSMNKNVRLKQISDPTLAGYDPMSETQMKNDGDYQYLRTWMSKSKFKQKYPKYKDKVDSIKEDLKDASERNRWVTENNVAYVDYWYKKYFSRKVALLSNGRVVDSEDKKEFESLLKLENANAARLNLPRVTVEKEEEHQDYEIIMLRMIANSVIEKMNWQGRKLPIIFAHSHLVALRNQERALSAIHWLKDTQRTYNYYRSEEAHRMQLTRHTMIILEEGMVDEKNIDDWRDIRRCIGAHYIKATPSGKSPIVVPPAAMPPQIQIAYHQCMEELQLIPGMFSASIGQDSSDSSGVAIKRRQVASNLSITDIYKNFRESMREGASVLLDLVQNVYDTNRRVSVVDSQNNSEIKEINNVSDESSNISAKKYEIELDMGLSFETQKQESVENAFRLAQLVPDFARFALDWMLENLDPVNGAKIIERVRLHYMPQIMVDEIKNPNEKAKYQQKVAQLQQAQQAPLEMQKAQLRAEIKAMSKESQAALLKGMAAMMDSQTKKEDVQLKGYETSEKVKAEERRTDFEEQKMVLDVFKGISGFK
jgi:hypothetical protein